MILNSPQDYSIELLDEGQYRLLMGSDVSTFSKPATTRGLAKVYTLSEAGRLRYVGIAEQPMSARLGYGLRATGANGYHGYKWKMLRQRLALSVWTGIVEERVASLREMETVEAEVAFLCRQESGQWPSHQHEIHFYESMPAHRAAASEIYRHAVAR